MLCEMGCCTDMPVQNLERAVNLEAVDAHSTLHVYVGNPSNIIQHASELLSHKLAAWYSL